MRFWIMGRMPMPPGDTCETAYCVLSNRNHSLTLNVVWVS